MVSKTLALKRRWFKSLITSALASSGCLFYFLFGEVANAQNLIRNPGAENWLDTNSFLLYESETNFVTLEDWFLNSERPLTNRNSAVFNGFGNFYINYRNLNSLYVRSGKGVFKLGTGLQPSNLARKPTIQTKLIDTLSPGCYYQFEAYLLPCFKLGTPSFVFNTGWAVSNSLDFLFSAHRPRDTISPQDRLFENQNYRPQLSLPKDTFFLDTTQFSYFSGVFQAVGGERYLTITNFESYDSVQFHYLPTGQVFYRWQMPNLFSSWAFFLDDLSLTLVPPPDSVFTTTGDTTICVGEPLTLFAHGEHAQWYLWSTGSTDSSITITQPGTYWVSCGFNCGFTKTDSIVVRPQLDVPPFVPSQDTVICPGDVVALFAPWSDALSYVWSNGSTDSTLQINQPGVYWVEAAVPCGHTRRFEINVAHYPELPDDLIFPTDTIICAGTSYNFDLQPGPEYLLNNELLAQPKLELSIPGVYTITAQNRCFEVAATFLLETEICASKMWMPNAFTPDGDGLNDCVAPVLVNVLERDYHLVITDRWGNVVFESTTPGACWDGSFRGQVQAGVYTWRLTYRGRENGFQRAQGFVQVLL